MATYNPSVPTSGGVAVTSGPYSSGLSPINDQVMGTSVWDAWTTGNSAGSFNPNAGGVNTTQLDGQSGFFDALSGFGQALLGGIGVQPDQPAQPQPVFWGGQPQQSQGIDTEMLMILGLVGFGVYFLTK